MVIVLQQSYNISTGHSSVLDPGALPRAVHTVAAVFLGVILVLGFLGNFLVLMVFSRFPGLVTPVNLLLINISASDMLVCIFGTPLSFAASVRGQWLTGSSGCRWYGFSNAFFGIVSLASLSLMSFERYCVLLHSSPSDSSQYRRARLAVAASWLYSLVWTLPPLLGWSSYGLEGLGTTCSVQWHQRSPTILLAVRSVERRVSRINRPSAERREGRVLLIVVSMVTGDILCWMPYGVVAMLASFGRPGGVSPAATLINGAGKDQHRHQPGYICAAQQPDEQEQRLALGPVVQCAS
ncbi:hypothetical protein KUCAC02_003810 [Chaenocephalus aceratus]|uniref:Uncharacterized protein n=1 Tax=Chaenocephalus aceratus TaxID=36190 RepID=A0ACB9WMD6_CHAAC|nr:hypothetical protein KUCAC02_003810 [Chaenocephalus aceratus]